MFDSQDDDLARAPRMTAEDYLTPVERAQKMAREASVALYGPGEPG